MIANMPDEHIATLGGLKQQKVRGAINSVPYESNVMSAGGGRLALSVSKKMMTDAGAAVGAEVELDVQQR